MKVFGALVIAFLTTTSCIGTFDGGIYISGTLMDQEGRVYERCELTRYRGGSEDLIDRQYGDGVVDMSFPSLLSLWRGFELGIRCDDADEEFRSGRVSWMQTRVGPPVALGTIELRRSEGQVYTYSATANLSSVDRRCLARAMESIEAVDTIAVGESGAFWLVIDVPVTLEIPELLPVILVEQRESDGGITAIAFSVSWRAATVDAAYEGFVQDTLAVLSERVVDDCNPSDGAAIDDVR